MNIMLLRNILNTAFILLAGVGMCLYYFSNRSVATGLIIAAIAFKFAELTIRIIYGNRNEQ